MFCRLACKRRLIRDPRVAPDPAETEGRRSDPCTAGSDILHRMHMLIRTVWHALFVGPRGRRIAFGEVSRSRFRVWPTDLDILRHMNNGKYLSIMDVARFDMLRSLEVRTQRVRAGSKVSPQAQRTSAWKVVQDQGWYPVVVNQTIAYRKSLNPWQRFWIETAILGFDEQAVYVEQRFVRPDAERRPEIYARAYVRARFLRRSGGTVPIEELMEKMGADPAAFSVPEDVLAWGRAARLPSTRADAVSTWE